MEEAFEISISRIKLTVLGLGAAIFILFGVFISIEPGHFISPTLSNEVVIRIIGFVSVVFFGGCLYWILRKFFEDKVGLRIDELGITDHSTGVSIGLIHWSDITGVETYQIYSSKFVVLMTDQPQKYIDKATNVLMKKAMQANANMCGSPLTINSNSLKIKHGELEKLLMEKWQDSQMDIQ
mgnify:CR=1 FL=1